MVLDGSLQFSEVRVGIQCVQIWSVR